MTITSPTDIDLLTSCALRYAMGRQSYIVGWTQEWVKQAWPHLSKGPRERFIRELDEELHRAEGRKLFLGSSFDHTSWQALRSWMNEHFEDPADGQ